MVIDGIYGNATKKAVINFQLDEDLKVEGNIGSSTLERLFLRCGKSKEEAYINSRTTKSETNYLIWVNSDKYMVNIYKGKTYKWELIKSFLSTLGKAETPTIKGVFKIGVKGLGYGGVNYGFRVKWYTQIYKDYLFHSILYNLDGTILDDRLGLNLSDGCIRLKEEDAKYIYDYIPSKTTVIIT